MHLDTNEEVEAELLEEDQGVIDENHSDYDDTKGRQVGFAQSNWVIVYEDGTIKTMHPSLFEKEFKEVS